MTALNNKSLSPSIFRLTVDTLIKMQNEEFLPVTNIHGQEYELKRSFLEGVIIAAWIFQFLAVGLNLICYLIHPMAVDINPTSKMFVYIWGRRFAFNGKTGFILIGFNKNIFSRVKRETRGDRG